jgi:cytochrome c peroxidase
MGRSPDSAFRDDTPPMRGNRIILVLLATLCAWAGACAQGVAQTVDPRWQALFTRPAETPASLDNPMTPEKVTLGARLFSDVRLTADNDRSCASCHQAARGFTDGRRRARGRAGAVLRRNTPPLWNLAWSKSFFWDGRAPTLEAQVAMPIAAADEMAGNWPTIVRRLRRDAGLSAGFAAAFPREPVVSQATIVKALAAYVRSLVSSPTRFDAWIAGDPAALTKAEVRGFGLFTGRAACVLCHVGWRFTDDRLHDIGLRGPDRGMGELPGGTPGLIAFKTPGLRDVARTAPYMHDGSKPTLAAVLRHYAGGFVARPSLAPHVNRALRLTARERSDLIAFLRTLSSDKGPGRASQVRPN